MSTLRVLLVEDDDNLRASLKLLLEIEGTTEVRGAASLADTVALGEAAVQCDVAVLDINLGPMSPSGVEVFRWLISRQFAGRIIFLTGHGKGHPLVAQALAIPGVSVLEKPQGVTRLLELVSRKGSDQTVSPSTIP